MKDLIDWIKILSLIAAVYMFRIAAFLVTATTAVAFVLLRPIMSRYPARAIPIALFLKDVLGGIEDNRDALRRVIDVLTLKIERREDGDDRGS